MKVSLYFLLKKFYINGLGPKAKKDFKIYQFKYR